MKICYFGIYNPEFSRNRVYIQGFKKLGVEIVECRDDTSGIRKYWRLWSKHKAIRGDYDAMIVGYPGHIVVPLAKLLSKKTVVADLLGSMYDAELHSHKTNYLHLLKLRLIDWLAVHFADVILLESEAQKKYFENRFFKSEKYKVVYTGVDENLFNDSVQDNIKPTLDDHLDNPKKFVAVFRGKLTPECGIEHILKAAKILKENNSIIFRIIGRGYLLSLTEKIIKEEKLKNVELISRYLSNEEMRFMVKTASLYLGQFENNHRLKRTIPHKAFESLAMKIPYLSADAPAIKELIKDGETGFIVPKEDGVMIANKIEFLSRHPDLIKEVGQNGWKLYSKNLTSEKLAKRIINFCLS